MKINKRSAKQHSSANVKHSARLKASEGHEEHEVSLSYYHQYWEKVEAMSNKRLFANQFEEITCNWYTDST